MVVPFACGDTYIYIEQVSAGKMIPEDVPVFKTCLVAVPPPTISQLREIPGWPDFFDQMQDR